MLRTIRCLSIASLTLAGTFAGCVTPHPQICKKSNADHGWVTIAGPSIPGATVPVETFGKSLVQCLNESQTTSILTDRTRISLNQVRQPIPLPTDSDLKSVTSLLELPLPNKVGVSLEKESLTRYDQLVEKMETLHRDFPGIAVPETWSQGWPYYLVEDSRNATGIEQLAGKIDSMPESQFKTEATQGFVKLQGKKLPATDRSELLLQLSTLARDGKIVLEQSEKIRGWCFASIGTLKQQNDKTDSSDINQKDKKDVAIIEFQAKGATFAKELQSLKVREIKSQSFAQNGFELGTNSYTPDEALLICVQKANQERVMLPLEMVYESDLGGLWLFPGDRIEILRFKEIAASQLEEGERRVGIMGMTASPGVLQTKGTVASSVISDVYSDIDPRANLLMITNEWNGAIVHTLLPYGASQVSATTQANIDSLLDRWGIQDGTLMKFELSQLSPIMVRSKAYQQRAAKAIAENATIQDRCKTNCVQKPILDANGTARTPGDLKLPSSPTIENGCKMVTDTAARSGTAFRDFGTNVWNSIVP